MRRILTALAAALLLSVHFCPAQTVDVTASQMADMLLQEARAHLGERYRLSAAGPDVFDCSGLTTYVFGKYGIKLGRSSCDQVNEGRAVNGSFANRQPGDLVFFNGRRNSGRVGHVGIVVEADSTGKDFTFIHAASTGVIISKYSEAYYTSRYVGARRVIPNIRPAD